MEKFLINSLAVECPELSLDWHPTKNLPMTILNTPFGSSKKVWWKCNICAHEWEAHVNNRRKQYKYPQQKGTSCPNCIGRVVNDENSFAAYNPDLVKEWHPKNTIFPNQIMKSNTTKYWWICDVCKNEWEATPHSRSCGHGCPLCSEFKNIKPNTVSKRWKQMTRKLILKVDK